MGMQGITDATVVLHGQNGCRKGLLLSQRLLVRSDPRNPKAYGRGFSVPYSNIRPEDYYINTSKKIEELIRHVEGEDYALSAVICSPGISIVGDDLDRMAGLSGRMMVVDSDSLPSDAPGGFDSMMRAVLEHLSPETGEKKPMGVNLIGLSIMHKDWSSFRHELSHLLKDAGFEVVCTLGAGCTVDEIRRSVNASYNIVIDPLYCRDTIAYYEDNHEIGTINIGRCPIGFDAFRELLERIGEVTGTMPEHGLSMLKKSMRRGYDGIFASGTELTGKTFRIVAPETTRIPLKEWLESSFGMVESDDRPDYLFAPGDMARLEQASGKCARGIDIGFPSSYGVDFLKKPLMGLEGAMYILDSLFNRCDGRTPPP